MGRRLASERHSDRRMGDALFLVQFFLQYSPFVCLSSMPCARLPECRSDPNTPSLGQIRYLWSANLEPYKGSSRPTCDGAMYRLRSKTGISSLGSFHWLFCRRFGNTRSLGRRHVCSRTKSRPGCALQKGCQRCIPISVDAPTGSVTVLCPICMERRSYIACTEVFLGSPSWEVMRTLQAKR